MSSQPPQINSSIPCSPRIWNYWMGGKDNYPVDQQAGDAGLQIDPHIGTMARESRAFLIRAVRHLAAEAGMRQFLDIGTGLPAMENTHEVAQKAAPQARVVYVDNDPSVLRHAKALLVARDPQAAPVGYIDSDIHTPELIIEEATKTLDLNLPVAVMFMGVLGHAHSYSDMQRIVRTVMAAVPPGSDLVLWDGTVDSQEYVDLCSAYAEQADDPYQPRTQDEIRAVFDGLTMIEPGFVRITKWRRRPEEGAEPTEISAYGAVAYKP